ncbi:MAG: hypothetical protein PHQ20_04730 [Candidatus Moranbacteria bacterium]|nr:hypothetical protein [Candidatus Moranbacteria bacterium]
MDSITKEILLYLYDCVDYGFSYKAKEGLYILDLFSHGRKKIDGKLIKAAIRNLSKSDFVEKKKNYDGSVIVSLTEKGILRALNYDFKRLYNKKEKWDGKWRMIAFDIPEEYRKGRDALRYRFRGGGFYELQESLFLYPYDCKKEIIALIKLFKLEKFVRFGIIEFIDNQDQIKNKLGIE